MNIFELMDSKYKSYTNTDMYIYDRCKKNFPYFASESIGHITERYSVSQASLTRFAKKLGFTGFNEFQYQLSQDLRTLDNKSPEESLAAVYGRVMQSVEETVDLAVLDDVAERLIKAEHAYFCGLSFSELPATYLEMSLRFRDINHGEFMNFYRNLYNLKKNHIVVLFSTAGSAAYASGASGVLFKHEREDYQVLVTMNPKHPLKQYFDQVIVLPDVSSAYGSRAVSADTMAFFMFAELLLQAIDRKKKTLSE